MEKVSFRFKISPLVWSLIAVVLCLLIVGVYLNVKNLIDFWGLDTLDTITYILTCVMDLALIVATVAGAINSKYIITKDTFIARLFISTKKYDVNSISEVVFYKNLNKLILRFLDGEYTVVVINKDNYQSFVSSLRQKNCKIAYLEENSEN